MRPGQGFRQALAAYVRGHDRVWTADAMRGGVRRTEAVRPEWGAPVPRRDHGSPEVAEHLDFRRGPALLVATREADHDG